MENFHIIQALCRCALADKPSNATRHQITRLVGALKSQGNDSMADCIQALLDPPAQDNQNLKIMQS